MSSTVSTQTRAAQRPAIGRAEAKELMTTEYARVLELLQALTPEDWRAPTCNQGWDVRALAAHMLGMAAMAGSVREQAAQALAARRRGGEFIDALTALQVEKYEAWAPERVVAEYARLAPRAVKGRTRTPGLLRRRVLRGQPVNPPHEHESWTFGYLVDVIMTRDNWMHRTDIAAATGRAMRLTETHDGAILDDVARDWARRHGQPCSLSLTGPLQRHYVFGVGGIVEASGPGRGAPASSAPSSYSLDAVDFCRILSGRGTGEGLLQTRVPF